MPEDITQFTAIGIIFVFAIREFFAYLKAKKQNGKINYDKEIAILNVKLNNHMQHIEEDITECKIAFKEINSDINTLKIEMVKFTALSRERR